MKPFKLTSNTEFDPPWKIAASQIFASCGQCPASSTWSNQTMHQSMDEMDTWWFIPLTKWDEPPSSIEWVVWESMQPSLMMNSRKKINTVHVFQFIDGLLYPVVSSSQLYDVCTYVHIHVCELWIMFQWSNSLFGNPPLMVGYIPMSHILLLSPISINSDGSILIYIRINAICPMSV